MTDTLEAFRHFREKMNAAILEAGNVNINRFFALDTRTYEAGALPVKTKELLGLALVVGGSIVIPHLRRALARLEELPAK
jgi:alkylhydroperoxidase/carboxymuconolactone decarboxylase family protein YurZ